MALARKQTIVQLSDTLLAALDQRASSRGVSRSQLIREAIEAYVAGDLDAEISRQVLAGYERHPQGELDPWGDPEEFRRANARQLHRRLDAEEASAGKEPW